MTDASRERLNSYQLDAVIDLVRRILGDDALGGYLNGSAVLGRLRPRSDTDVLGSWPPDASPRTSDRP